jgi:prepilin-type N-terminal cleavage/methylation domain-containing protein/prepilin-type processing-associated H-X9-DG protein
LLVKRAGLTLIELIVVTVIIAVLAGIITTVSLRAIGSAKRSTCLSNLKNLGLSIQAYAADHDDMLPPYFWVGGSSTANPSAFKSALKSYGMTESLWYCPLDQNARTTFPGEYGTHLESSYLFNVLWGIKANRNGVFSLKLTSVPYPSDTTLFCDQFTMEKDENGKWISLGNHGTDSNILFFDGHVKNLIDPVAMVPPPPN